MINTEKNTKTKMGETMSKPNEEITKSKKSFHFLKILHFFIRFLEVSR